MASILITGISGFIGRYLAKHLQSQGHDVIGTTMQGMDGQRVCDLRDRDQLDAVLRDTDPDVVIHLAALSSVTEGKTLQYYETNLIGTENLLQGLDAIGRRRRLIFVSTAGVYGNQPTGVLSEDLTPLPVSHYGISKYAAERLVFNFSDRHDITVTRPFNVIGVGQNGNFVVPKLVRHFAERAASIRLGRLDPVRDYIDVHSTCDIFARLIGEPKAIGATVNICSGRGTSVRELLDILVRVSGHEMEVISAPEFIRANEVFSLLGDTTRLDALLPQRHALMPVEEVIRGMLKEGEARVAAGAGRA
ncbi:NAD-dependent epimerase/dehydratase family protein [Burkholderia sp. Ac-20379]|uniref:NAD-dependent epimerase/dehydratase family protein n=1 Tax=Burkholderia sp. Ac-20379 TaxID=2703900 RepID=UPI00197F4188|nr:NAD-dependent epimerase/dehydratase family protein [Burkholderia sp. Ac-20379]MBN3724962.1 NAD-dependent epimerase/dehydratase family protein [Burkholderia sp. Ac-20379]